MKYAQRTHKGASIKYVRTKGGGGPKIGQFCGQTVLQKCGQGGEEVQKSENYADVPNGSPLTNREEEIFGFPR